MKKLKLTIAVAVWILFFAGCGGYQISERKILYTDNRNWVEANYDLFFAYSTEYANFETENTKMIGRLKANDVEYSFEVNVDGAGNLYFTLPQQAGESTEILLFGYYFKSGDDFYEIRIYDTDIPEIIPKDAILHFNASDIEISDLYIPDFLGDRKSAADNDEDS